jgi:hypothetical protein
MTLLTFLTDYGAYLVILVIVATWKLWAPRVIAHTFNKDLAKYKTDLETEKEKQLAEYGKRITGFNKFFDKKYEFYPVLYSKVIRLHGELSQWAPMQGFPNFDSLTKAEFSKYVDTFGFSEPDKRELGERKDSGVVCNEDFYRLLPRHFQFCIATTNNYFLEKRLFLSTEIDSLVAKFIGNAHKIRSRYGHVFSSQQNMDQWGIIEETNKENAQVILDLLHQMKSELEFGVPNKV